MSTAILLLSCPDRRGLVARIAGFVFDHGGNIIHADHHTDFETELFLTRIEWAMDDFDLSREALGEAVAALAVELDATAELHFSDKLARLAIWVTKQDHCLLDLIWRVEAGELHAEIPVIISNHRDLEPLAARHGIEFRHFEITKENKPEQEKLQLELLRDMNIDLVVLAKYMRILSADFLREFPTVINIHHSFLPAFAGANPYRRAHNRGVKIIGATAHYATAELDDGPIIDQDVARVSHRDSVGELIRRGRDLERMVLACAVRFHLASRVLVYRNRTVIFD